MRVLLGVIVVANATNAFLNWVFVYGHLGSPAMGAPGSAWATLASRWLMAFLLLALAGVRSSTAIVPWRRRRFISHRLLAMLRLGLPIGFMQALEIGAFAAIGVLMGVLGHGADGSAPDRDQPGEPHLHGATRCGIGGGGARRSRGGRGRFAEAARESARAALACGVGLHGVHGHRAARAPHAFAALYTQ
jgi:hypothetical protein